MAQIGKPCKEGDFAHRIQPRRVGITGDNSRYEIYLFHDETSRWFLYVGHEIYRL